VPDTGIRDEYGMEPMDIFSSPQKGGSARKSNGKDATITSDEDMEMTSSTQPDPKETLYSAHSARRMLLPPKSRSPLKTTLGSSPRRSVGPASSPMRRDDADTPSRGASLPAIARKLDFSISTSRMAAASPRSKSRSSLAATIKVAPRLTPSSAARKGKSKRRPFHFSNEGDGEEETSLVASRIQDDEVIEQAVDDSVDDSLLVNGDESRHAGGDGEAEPVDVQEDDEDEEHSFEDKDASVKGQKEKERAAPQAQPSKSDTVGIKRRGRPKTVAKETTHDTSGEVDIGPSAKRTRRESLGTPSQRARRTPAERGSNARIVSSKAAAKVKSKPKITDTSIELAETAKVKPAAKTQKKQKTNSLLQHEVRHDQVGEEIVPTLLRSGRTSVKPLAYWRGERALYTPTKKIGKDYIPGGFQGVEPGREIIERAVSRGHAKRGKRKRAIEDINEEDEDEGEEPWETEGERPGVLEAAVLAWDVEEQKGTEEEYEEIGRCKDTCVSQQEPMRSWKDPETDYSDAELALAPAALNSRMRNDKANTFKFGKTLTMPFFHSGIVDLPPGGEKRVKNSRKNHMIFWVFSGRVVVDVSGNSFSIGRGGMWQVPRGRQFAEQSSHTCCSPRPGNFYSLSNPFSKDARIFFAQGCYVEQPDEEEEAAMGTPGPSQQE